MLIIKQNFKNFTNCQKKRDDVHSLQIQLDTKFRNGEKLGRVNFIGDQWPEVVLLMKEKPSGFEHQALIIKWQEKFIKTGLSGASDLFSSFGLVVSNAGIGLAAGSASLAISLTLSAWSWYEEGEGWLHYNDAKILHEHIQQNVDRMEAVYSDRPREFYCSKIYPYHSMLSTWVHEWSRNNQIFVGDRNSLIQKISTLTAGEKLPDPMWWDQYSLEKNLCPNESSPKLPDNKSAPKPPDIVK